MIGLYITFGILILILLSTLLYKQFFKRFYDVMCASFALLVFSWLYIILALLVKIMLGSPIIFKQARSGKIDPQTGKERTFYLRKFRSMTNEKDEHGNLLPDAERLTDFGRFLRSTSLDELPEVINILLGDMSIIGPRPWGVDYLEYYTVTEHKRHLVRPGLSGYAQVNGRTDLPWLERIKYDLEYVEKQSLWFDITIIAKTVLKVIKRSDVVMTAEDQGNFSDFRIKQIDDGIDPDLYYSNLNM